MTSHGAKGRASTRQRADISRCCSGRARTDARGTSRRASTRRRAGTSRCCSGRARTAARGTRGRAERRRCMDTSRCFSGRARTAVRGTGGRAITQRRTDTSICCSGRSQTAAPGWISLKPESYETLKIPGDSVLIPGNFSASTRPPPHKQTQDTLRHSARINVSALFFHCGQMNIPPFAAAFLSPADTGFGVALVSAFSCVVNDLATTPAVLFPPPNHPLRPVNSSICNVSPSRSAANAISIVSTRSSCSLRCCNRRTERAQQNVAMNMFASPPFASGNAKTHPPRRTAPPKPSRTRGGD